MNIHIYVTFISEFKAHVLEDFGGDFFSYKIKFRKRKFIEVHNL